MFWKGFVSCDPRASILYCPKMCHSTTGLSLKLACWYNHQMDWLFPAELMKLLFVTPFPSAFGKLGLGQR